MISYHRYMDLKNEALFRPTKKLKNKDYKIPTETYTLVRTTHNVQPFNPPLRLTKYDINENGEMICIQLRIPRYIDAHGCIQSEELDVFESKYSPRLKEKILEDFLSLKMSMTDFEKKYKLTGKSAEVLSKLLLDIGKRNEDVCIESCPTTRIWLLRTQHQKKVLTFCVDVTTDTPSVFDVLLSDEHDYTTVAYALSVSVLSPNSVEYICGNYSPLLREALEKYFHHFRYLTDSYQLAYFIDDVIPIITCHKCIDELLSIRLKIIELYSQRPYIHPETLVHDICAVTDKYPSEEGLKEKTAELICHFNSFSYDVHEMQGRLVGFRTKLPFQLQYATNQLLKKRVNLSPALIRLHFILTQYDLQVSSVNVALALREKKYMKALPLHNVYNYDDSISESILFEEISSRGVTMDYLYELYTNATNNDRD